MIIESPAAFKLMGTLAELGAEGATREHLVSNAGVGTTTFYRLIGSLTDNGLVTVRGGRYALAFENPYAMRFKLWHDMERLYRLTLEDRDTVVDVMSQIRSRHATGLRALWLIGSGARAELESKSDLDFLLVSSEEAKPVSETGRRRDISITSMSDEAFRDAYTRADSFVVSALREGIVLLDREFVREFYLTPPPVKIAPDAARAAEPVVLEKRKRVLSDLARDDIEQAQLSLQSQAIHVARLMLRTFGELPASKQELVSVSKAYFGPEWADTLNSAVTSPPTSKDLLVVLSRRILEQHDSFQDHAAHLQRFSKVPISGGRDMENICAKLLSELIPNSALSRANDKGRDRETDFTFKTSDGGWLLVECKSFRGSPSKRDLEQAIQQIQLAQNHLKNPSSALVIVNDHVEVPPSERPALPAELDQWRRISPAKRKRSKHLRLVTGMQLLCIHNQFHLEKLLPEQALDNLLHSRHESIMTI
jgi:hypothetical protein